MERSNIEYDELIKEILKREIKLNNCISEIEERLIRVEKELNNLKRANLMLKEEVLDFVGIISHLR